MVVDKTVDLSKCWIEEKYRYESVANGTFLSVDPRYGWMGIPNVLLVNSVLGLISLFFFTFMRKRFWDYGRIAWRLFTPGDPVLDSNYDVFVHVDEVHSSKPAESAADRGNKLEDEDTGNFTWLYLWAELTDEEILIKCGPSAIQYLQFQDVILSYLSVVTSFCLLFLLPINMMGHNFGDPALFSMTTIANLNADNILLYVHSVVAVGFFVHGIYNMRLFARHINVPGHYRHYKHGMPKILPRAAIMITGLPSTLGANEEVIAKYFGEAYGDCEVKKVQFAYDVHDLVNLTTELKEATVALNEAERTAKKGEMMTVRHCRLLNIFPWRCLRKVDPIEFYKNGVARLTVERNTALQAARKRPLPICFVTFEKSEQTDKIVSEFRRCCRMSPLDGRPNSDVKTSVDSVLHPRKWEAVLAPKATDIAWENLGMVYKKWVQIALNVGVLLILFFLSTPSIFLNVYAKSLPLERGNGTNTTITQLSAFWNNPIMRQLVPTTLHLTFTALLPYAIEGCEEYSRHDTRSDKEIYLMQKTLIYFLFMVLFLPSFGIMSGHYLVSELFGKETTAPMNRWDCLFLPENPAFFVNFLITTALVGTAIQLIRPGHIVYYIWRICGSRSRFELENAKAGSLFKFPYGYSYAFNLAIFAVTMSYCVVCPLVAPCGFFYFCLKSQVDRYNIYFAFDAHYVPQQMHRRAANCVLGCCILSQGALIAFTIFRSGGRFIESSGGGFMAPANMGTLCHNILMILMFALSLALFAFQMCTGWFFYSAEINPFIACLGDDSDASSSGGFALPHLDGSGGSSVVFNLHSGGHQSK